MPINELPSYTFEGDDPNLPQGDDLVPRSYRMKRTVYPDSDLGGEFCDTQTTIDANLERVKTTENPKPEEKQIIKWTQE